MDTLFSSEALKEYALIWRGLQNGEDFSDDFEVEMVVQALKDHPEFDPFWEQGDAALHPQEIDGYKVNPLIHTRLHVLIEKQLEDENPLETKETYDALIKAGIPRHEAIHRIAGLWGNFYFKAIREGSFMDEYGYIQALKGLVQVSKTPD